MRSQVRPGRSPQATRCEAGAAEAGCDAPMVCPWGRAEGRLIVVPMPPTISFRDWEPSPKGARRASGGEPVHHQLPPPESHREALGDTTEGQPRSIRVNVSATPTGMPRDGLSVMPLRSEKGGANTSCLLTQACWCRGQLSTSASGDSKRNPASRSTSHASRGTYPPHGDSLVSSLSETSTPRQRKSCPPISSAGNQ